MTKFSRMRRFAPVAVAALVVTTIAAFHPGGVSFNAQGCAPGFHRWAMEEQKLHDLLGAKAAQTTGPCVADKHPETPEDMQALETQRAAIASSPDGYVPSGAFSKAVKARLRVLASGQSAANAHSWTPVGTGPLHGGEPGYPSVNTVGDRDLNGRITDFEYVPSTDKYYPDTLFASVGYGGIWMTDSSVQNWISIGDSLPIQTMGAVAYTPNHGGTVIALSGDGSFGADSREGAGVFYTYDLGKTWKHATGVPDDAFGFRLAVDKAHPAIVYAATGTGLFRSTNGGASFTNTSLPTGDCAGKSNRTKACLLANMVTDVVVMAPGGVSKEKGGKVMAAVGWRGGNTANPDGSIQSPANGIYTSADGAPGSFVKSAASGFAAQERIGRVELGPAIGPGQDHNFVYAMVQDAVLQRKGLPYIDAPGVTTPVCVPNAPSLPVTGKPCARIPTVFNGLYVSPDFGATWVLVTDATALQNPATGSALIVNAALGGYGPGVQAWYNEWVAPDPTLADPVTGAPTRVLFGLEEIWENDGGTTAALASKQAADSGVPVVGPTTFHVIGRYWSGDTCFGTGLLPAGICPANRDAPVNATTTTHPDQHDALFIPHSDGRVTLVAGNDGGAYKQTIAGGADFSNSQWGDGASKGMHTLLPYDAARAKDGTIWMGLQDNGTAKIVDIKRKGVVIERQRQIQTFGGDGFFVAVDPNDGNYAYEEYVGGTMSATTDGGHTWTSMSPPITNAQFSTAFVMDPLDPKHVMIAGREVVETGAGAGTSSEDWGKAYDLGTGQHPGDASATASATDPANQMSAIDLFGNAAYVGFCGTCDVLNSKAPFKSGLATNVGGSKPPKRFNADGWHIAAAKGLPNRYITSVAMDQTDPSTVFVGVGGYFRPWTPPNVADTNAKAGKGHLFVSTDAGKTFQDISANLPDTPVNWVTLRGNTIIVATDVGIFVSDPTVTCANSAVATCEKFEVLGKNLPAAAVFTVRVSGGDLNTLVAATYGRGVYEYHFGAPKPYGPKAPKKLPPPKFANKSVAGPFKFDTSAEGWTAKSNNAAEKWSLLPPGANNSAQSFQIVPYSDESSASLISPKMSLPVRSAVKLSWFERTDTEECCDFLSMDWSSDGFVWHPSTFTVAGQNKDFPDFSPASASFVAPAGDLYVRFRLGSDQLVSSPPYTGVAIDEVKVER